jgi:hypothetical protein
VAWWNFGKRKRQHEIAAELMAAEADEPTATFSWITIVVWAARLLVWLLSKHPNLIIRVLDIQTQVARHFSAIDRAEAEEALRTLKDKFMANKDVVQIALRGLKS